MYMNMIAINMKSYRLAIVFGLQGIFIPSSSFRLLMMMRKAVIMHPTQTSNFRYPTFIIVKMRVVKPIFV